MLLDAVFQNSRRLASRPALRCGEETISWSDLWPWAESLAHRLRRGGARPVAVAAGREAWVPAAFLACLIAGRPYLPLDPLLPALRREELLQRTGAEELTRRAAYAGFRSGGRCEAAGDPGREAYILFTSGSTGAPKEVAVSLRNLEHFLSWASSLPGAGAAGGVTVGQAAYSFDLSVADLYLSLLQGGTHQGLTRREMADPAALFSRLRASGMTFLSATPSFLRLCLRENQFSHETLPGLHTVFSCGEALPVKTARTLLSRFPGLTLLNAYGPTEATCAVSAAVITPALCTGEALPIGEAGRSAVELALEGGEIVLCGESVAPAYGSRYHTGDLGLWRDGLLYWSGRKDDQLKYKGYRVEPAEIEAALEAIEGVEHAAVLPRTHRDGSVLGLTAFWEGGAPAETVKAAAGRRLPPYLLPTHWAPLPRLPLTRNGKVDRLALKESSS